MPYPESPFEDDFNDDLLVLGDLPNRKILIKDLKQWLCKTPNVTTIRFDPQYSEIEAYITKQLQHIYVPRGIPLTKVYKHDKVNVIIVEHLNTKWLDLQQVCREVIVDHKCASALLRGAHLFAPGVIGMTKDCKIGAKVSIFADLNIKNKCKRGFAHIWESPRKVFIANGIVELSRNELFTPDACTSGIAVRITDTISGAPPLDSTIFAGHNAMLQNIPSVVTVECLELNKQSSQKILDMCASPGGKTSHILTTMQPSASLIACDKTCKKVTELKNYCEIFSDDKTQVTYKTIDWTIVTENAENEFNHGFKFSNILLDAPCSASGNRPQLLNTDKDSVLKSFVPIQRKMITQAVKMLQDGGILVYSTCSVAMGENEGVVAFALKHFDLELVPSIPKLGGDGWECDGVPHPDYLQRFGPGDDNIDSIGFFIAKFRKKYQNK